MLPEITILGHTISAYGLMIVIGICAIVIYFLAEWKRFGVMEADVQLTIIYGAIGAFVGSKLLYVMTILPQLISVIQEESYSIQELIVACISGGFVFYGGVYGAWAAAVLYCRYEKIDWWAMAEYVTPIVPLFHIFGRIGCFLAGCCYGIEFPFGVTYTASEIAPNNVSLLPIQLMEAVGELILFAVLIKMKKKEDIGRQMTAVWFIGYGVMRFILEFFRGDECRGSIGCFSV